MMERSPILWRRCSRIPWFEPSDNAGRIVGEAMVVQVGY